MTFTSVGTIARQEFVISLRSRWIVGFAALFAALSLAIACFGAITAGAAGLQGFERTTASLLNLVLYVVPLLGLTLGTLNISREHPGNELLFSQPLSRPAILCGRLVGLFSAVATTILAGFSVAAAVICIQIGSDGLGQFAALVMLSILLSATFLSAGALVGLGFRSRTKALGLALVLWFFFVFLYDLIIIGAVFLIPERPANLMIFVSLFGNPVELARVSSLLAIGDATMFGAAGAALLKFLGGAAQAQTILLSALAAWLVLPLAAAFRVVRRLDL